MITAKGERQTDPFLVEKRSRFRPGLSAPLLSESITINQQVGVTTDNL
ncbi:hypothetical protein [Salinivibrio sp. SS3]|nr:hypothetical protein [Salinivibrio sp. BNH]